MRIAEPAIAAAQQHDTLAGLGQVGEHGLLVVVEDLGPDRHAQHEIAALGAGLVGAGAATPFLGTKMLLITVVDQRVQIVRRLEHDVAALAAIAAIKLCAALAHDDVARQHDLATEFLDTEPPPAAVAAVAGRAACLFMGHPLPPTPAPAPRSPRLPSLPAVGPPDGCAWRPERSIRPRPGSR